MSKNTSKQYEKMVQSIQQNLLNTDRFIDRIFLVKREIS